jgi:uncharacterized protein YunC (DUF1805 family)
VNPTPTFSVVLIHVFMRFGIQPEDGDGMIEQDVPLRNSVGTGFVIPLGPVSLVAVATKIGLVGCGAFDVAALNTFGYPAARVKGAGGAPVASIGDLLSGVVREANITAEQYGVTPGMTGREALDRLS